MKKLYFSLILLFSSVFLSSTLNINSQSFPVDIGTQSVTNQAIPIEPYYGYTYSQSIYLASEMGGASGPITAIKFYATTATTLASSDLWDVWIKEVPTTFANFNNATNFEDITTFTQVFSGQVTINNGVVRIDFSSPFQYTGNGNIIIAVDQNRPGYDSGAHDFYCSNDGTTDARAITYRSDGINPDPLNPPTGSSVGGRSNYPNITFLSESCTPVTSLAASNLTTSSADISWTPSGSEISYNLEYGPTGFTQGTGTSSTFSAIGKIAVSYTHLTLPTMLVV